MSINPFKRGMPGGMERRVVTTTVEIAKDSRTIVGFPIVFDSLSEDLGGFRERVAPTALNRTLQENKNVIGLFNHDTSCVLGCQENQTLKLRINPKGLEMECDPPATHWADDLLVSMRRGDIRKMSFGFYVARDGEVWEGLDGKGPIVRTLTDIDLVEVSVVTIPAYRDTSAAVRSLSDHKRALCLGKLEACRSWKRVSKCG